MIIMEKKHRLPRKEYIGLKRVSYTICVKNHSKAFNNSAITIKLIDILRETMGLQNAGVIIYVFMPNHMHMVLEGLKPDSDLWAAVKVFKQRSGLWLTSNTHFAWQKDYYDHVHRENENLFNSIWYIANNPVRKGLVKNVREFRWLGSMTYDVDVLLESVERAQRAV